LFYFIFIFQLNEMSDDDNDDEPPPPPLAGSTAAAPTSAKSFLGPYVRVVKTNVDFRILWLSNVFSELGYTKHTTATRTATDAQISFKQLVQLCRIADCAEQRDRRIDAGHRRLPCKTNNKQHCH